MKRISALTLFCLLLPAFASGQSPQLRSGATVFIEPMDGYETYLAAAFVKKHVPLIVVTRKEKAQYIIKGGLVHNEPSESAVVVNNTATASINEGENPNQGAFKNGFNQGLEASRERAAAKAALGYSNASISIADPASTQIVFAYSAGKDGTNQFQKTAEDCAKHLKEFIEKSKKNR